MTEKEFEQLKVGDKVWIITDWFNKSNEGMKAVQIEVSAKDNETETIKFIGGAFNRDFCFLTKAEAWEREIASFETHLEYREEDLKRDRQELDRYKAELAKAKEEGEVSVWTVDFDEGTVVRSTKRRWEGSAENYEWSLGSPRYKPCETEHEAYEALAKFRERKLFKALEKCGYKFAIPCDKWIVPMLVRAEEDVCRVIYYPSHSYGCVRKQDLFDTLEEAEAELERRKAK